MKLLFLEEQKKMNAELKVQAPEANNRQLPADQSFLGSLCASQAQVAQAGGDTTEMDAYLQSDGLPFILSVETSASGKRKLFFGDELKWWSANEKRFPVLARLAQKYLAVPATSVPSERLFSVAGWLLNKKRARMADDTLDDQMLSMKTTSYKKEMMAGSSLNWW